MNAEEVRQAKKDELRRKIEARKQEFGDDTEDLAVDVISDFFVDIGLSKTDSKSLGIQFRARQLFRILQSNGVLMALEVDQTEDPYSEATWDVPETRHGQVSVRTSDGAVTSTGVLTPYDSEKDLLGHARALLTAHRYVTEVR